MKAMINAPKENGDTGPGYNWRHHTPTTRNYILELLKSNEIVDIATKGNLVEVMGCVFKRGNGLTLQVGSSKWAKEGVNQWIDAMKYKCVMGDDVDGGRKVHNARCCTMFQDHSATNSLQTQIRRIERDKYKHQLTVCDTRGKISSDSIMTVNLEGELPTRMKEALTRKDGYVFKVRAMEGRNKEGTGELALKIMAIVQESHENRVKRHTLEEMVQHEIVRVYEKEEDTENEKGEKDSAKREEGEERTTV